MRTDYTDDEEDLEALRLAALSSLKKKEIATEIGHNQYFAHEKHHNYKGSFRGGKKRFFQGQSGRGNRNGQFNNQVRNSNLICISTSTDVNVTSINDQKISKLIKKDDDIPKLVRPQDRYANKTDQEVENEGPVSKFDRYNNSNSESEDDEITSATLERSDSLEALMEELDAEIQGETRKDKKDKLKTKKEVKLLDDKITHIVEDKNEINERSHSDVDSTSAQVIIHNTDEQKENPPISPTAIGKDSKASSIVQVKLEKQGNEIPFNKHLNQNSPSQRKMTNWRSNGRIFSPEPNFISTTNNPILVSNPPFVNPLPSPQFTPVYNTMPPFTGPDVFPLNVPPPTFVPPPGIPPHILPSEVPPTGFNTAPLLPLIIEPLPSLSSIPLGPLSPRSAAFVLQNRAIVEKRKRSPRRSFSRSPSPPSHRLRYSKSPPSRRSLSPLRRSPTPLRRSFSPSRSISPRRSPIRRSLSPYRRHREKLFRQNSPRRSPRRLRDSPKRSPKSNRDSPKRSKESRRTPIKERLGPRNKIEEKDVKKKEEPTCASPIKEDLKAVDPVLEARKRKFESKEIKVKEGVIRLKPKALKGIEEENQESDNVKVKDDLRNNLKGVVSDKPAIKEEISTRIVLLPKDEEKNTSVSAQNDQLEEAMNELEMLLKDEEALELTAKVDDLFSDEETDQENEGRFKVKIQGSNEKTKVSLCPKQSDSLVEKKNDTKTKWNFDDVKKESKIKKIKKEPLTNPIENRKIEIKIRNPSKYEKNGSKVLVSNQVSSGRKVELTEKQIFSDEESEPEILVANENDDEDIEDLTTSKDGDLRAQLSRKRAERQNKLPTVEGVPPRLLQSAFEGAVFKKKKSKKKEKETRDVKLPIHLRLGIAHDSDIFAEAATEKISRKKSKKRKHAAMEQV